jgi:hypothetical protein
MLTRNSSVTELADNAGGKFRRFWKQLAEYGDWVDPRGGKKPMKLDQAFCQKLSDNFKSGVGGFIPAPLGHPKTDAELAAMNRGELIDTEAREDGFYGLIEIRDDTTASQIDNKLIPDVSMAFTDDYQDKKTGKWVGPMLRHIGLVANPYLKGMQEFEPALSDSQGSAVLFSDSAVSTGGNNNEKENITMSTVKNERDFEVTVKYTEEGAEKEVVIAAGAEIEVPEDQVEAVTQQITDAVAPVADDEEEEEELSDADKKAQELADREAAVAKREAELSEKAAEANYERLLSEGKIVPAQKDAYLALASRGSEQVELSDESTKTIDVLLSELFENGVTTKNLSEQGADDDDGDDDEEVELSDEEKSLAKSLNIDEEAMKQTKKELENK